MRYGVDMAAADAVSELLRHMPEPGTAPPRPGGPPMHPGPPPPGARPPGPPGHPGHPGHPGYPPHPGMVPNKRDALPQAGGESDGFAWKQDTDEVEVSVTVPATATKAQVKVSIKAKQLRVEHAGAVLVDGTLAAACEPEGSTWTISKGRVIISLEKTNPGPWPALLKT